MGELTWKKFNKVPAPAHGEASSGSRIRKTDRADNDESDEEEAQDDAKINEGTRDCDNKMDTLFDNIEGLYTRVHNMWVVQNKIETEQFR